MQPFAATVAEAAPSAAPARTGTRLRECPDCGLFQRLPPLPRNAVARCHRCNAVLRRRRHNSAGRALALAITGTLLFALALGLPFMNVEVAGRGETTTVLSGPFELEQNGAWELSIAVLVTTLAAPAGRLAALIYVLLAIRLPRPPRHVYAVFRWVEWLGPWSMVEVFLLGVFVAYTRVVVLAHVQVGGAVYALAGLMLAMAAADGVLDHEAVWQELERRGVTARQAPDDPAPGRSDGRLWGCDSCGLVSRATLACPRCGAAVRYRKQDSLQRTWALLIAAAILYIPANTYPVLTLIRFGRGDTTTILDGVGELAAAGMWPLAALVFFASILVPVLKLIGLSFLLVSTHRGARTGLHERTLLYRIVDSIGRWSMIDVFMISILTALVRLGALASIYPGSGAVAFCGVVILTIVAAHSFDPRLMWDAAERPAG
jgi:paraquat-inducible protein A